MNPFPYIYATCLAVVLTAEVVAVVLRDKPDTPRTITANIKAITSLPGPWWHRAARVGLIALLAWLPPHLGLVDVA